MLSWNKKIPENSKNYILYILPNTGMDKKTYQLIKRASKNNNIIIITLENAQYSHYALRQKYEVFATVFDLTTFLDEKYWLGFIEYIINTRNIEIIYISEDYKNIEFFKNKTTNFFRYKESRIKYNLVILEYKIKKSLLCRAIRKIFRTIKQHIN